MDETDNIDLVEIYPRKQWICEPKIEKNGLLPIASRWDCGGWMAPNATPMPPSNLNFGLANRQPRPSTAAASSPKRVQRFDRRAIVPKRRVSLVGVTMPRVLHAVLISFAPFRVLFGID